MKLKGLFAIMAAALMLSMSFTSCEGLDGLFDDENESTDNQAFFPNSYRQRTVAAWYSLTEKEENGTRIEAVFLFDDNSFVTTKSRTYTDGRSQERKILAEGDYTLTGDYENGTAEVSINGTPEPMTIEIKDGKMMAMGETFTKQSNKKVPKPSEESEGGDGGHGGDGDGGQGDGGQGDGLEAFFPTGYSDKTVDAWFSEAGKQSEQGYDMKYNASIYFFTDGIFVATVHTEIEGPQGPITNKLISISGEYTILKGDYTNGDIKLKGADGKVVTVEIREGKLTYVEVDGKYTIYVKKDNTKVPQASEPTGNGQQGGDGDGGQGQQGGDGDGGDGDEVPAFFPKAYADKTVVAWYSFSEGEKGETRVEAVFLFENDVVIVTENKVFSEEFGMGPERYIKSVGSYKLREGDYENGLGLVELSEVGQHQVKIAEGVLTVDGLYGEYIKRALADIPDPLDPTDQGQQGGEGQQGGDDGEGGEGDEFDDSLLRAYLPADFASLQIAACYMFVSDVENSTKRVESIFLFTDKSLIVTKTTIYSKSAEQRPEYKVTDKGRYELTEGSDYENGTASVVTADGATMEVAIEEGIMTVKETTFVKIPDELIPYTTTNGK